MILIVWNKEELFKGIDHCEAYDRRCCGDDYPFRAELIAELKAMNDDFNLEYLIWDFIQQHRAPSDLRALEDVAEFMAWFPEFMGWDCW